MKARLLQHFDDSIQVKRMTRDLLLDDIILAANLLVTSLQQGGKILVCGNGGSAADAQHFSAELLNRFEKERPGLPAIALTTDSSTLTAIANDYAFHQIFSKQVAALGQSSDILLAISTSGQSENINAAIRAAHQKQMKVIALTGKDGGVMVNILQDPDVTLCVPDTCTARIQETHILILHCLCDLIDHRLLVDA